MVKKKTSKKKTEVVAIEVPFDYFRERVRMVSEVSTHLRLEVSEISVNQFSWYFPYQDDFEVVLDFDNECIALINFNEKCLPPSKILMLRGIAACKNFKLTYGYTKGEV